jgi:hypothetical protein
MKQKFKILVKDIKDFIKTERVLFASDGGKKLYVALHAGPNVRRYIIEHQHGKAEFFVKVGDAVRRFNEI